MLQTNATLNLLRYSLSNPKISAFSFIRCLFDFNSAHMALPGTKTLVNSHPKKRNSMDLNRDSAWHVGPSLNKYRCV